MNHKKRDHKKRDHKKRDYKELASRIGFDEDDFHELVELFVTTSLSDIDKIKKAVLQNNCKETAAASHSVKGASGNLGFDDIFALASDMEMQAKNDNLEDFDSYINQLENSVNALK
jgi:histidine phosphotransfer protein HptB